MATIEANGILEVKDANGNLYLVYPVTKKENIADLENATQTEAGLFSGDDKKKLDGIASGANKYSHPTYTAKSSGFYKVTVNSTGHVSGATAVTKADITALGIPAQDTTYSAATTSANGLMSATDKKKLDGFTLKIAEDEQGFYIVKE